MFPPGFSQIPGDKMCTEQAARVKNSTAKTEAGGMHPYICGGLFMGRCWLIKKMLNLVDEVIAQDGGKAGYFDQALYGIMQQRK